jgi:hypothetical protein
VAESAAHYITRPAIANERLKRNGAGDVVLRYLLAKHDQQGFSGRRVPDVDLSSF